MLPFARTEGREGLDLVKVVMIAREDSKEPAFYLGIETQALTGMAVRLSTG